MKRNFLLLILTIVFASSSKMSGAQNSSNNHDQEKLEDDGIITKIDSIFSYYFFKGDSLVNLEDRFNWSDSLITSNEVYKKILESFQGMNESFQDFLNEDSFLEDIDKVLEDQFQEFFDKENIDNLDKVVQDQLKNFQDFFENKNDSIIDPKLKTKPDDKKKEDKKKGVKN